MEAILEEQKVLTAHPLYQKLNNLESIRHFMQYHVFAVWDFMSLLKSLQTQITCVNLPWRPSSYPTEIVRFINQIVVGEESDVDQEGNAISHFDLYLKGMEEIGADTSKIKAFMASGDMNLIPKGAREFVEHNLKTAHEGSVEEVAASFFFGREKLIPEMFQSIVNVLEREKVEAPTFLYYLERHIEVDGHEHGPLALKCLDILTKGDKDLIAKAHTAGMSALKERSKLWDHVLSGLNNT